MMLKEIQSLSHCDDFDELRLWCVVWNKKGNLLASCGADRCIRVYGEEETLHSRTIRSLSFSPCGRYLAAASFDCTISIWRWNDDEFEHMLNLEGHENEVKCVSWSPSGQYLASCSRDKSVWIWEADEDDDFECCSILNNHSQDVKFVQWHPNKEILMSSGYDDTVRAYIFDEVTEEWTEKSCIRGHDSTVWSVAFNVDGSKLASCSDDQSVKVWKECQSGSKLNIFSKQTNDLFWSDICHLSGYHNGPVYSISWCPLTNLICTGSGDNGVRIFKENSASETAYSSIFGSAAVTFEMECHKANAHELDVNCVAWNPKRAGLLATCGDDGKVKLWQCSDSDSV